MKKFFVSAALLAMMSAAAGAQTLSEALLYSQNNYYGTARTMALSNAVTALGGDLGSIGINPAGSAVSPYSQFTISPGVTLSSNSSSYSSWVDDPYSDGIRLDSKKGNLPNLGFVLNFDTYRDYGLKSYSIGFVSNSTSNYLGGFRASGVNDMTSILGSFAVNAGSYTPGMLSNTSNYYGSSIPWNQLVAYQSGMISEVFGIDGNPLVDGYGNYTYAGATEGIYLMGDGSYDIHTMGALNQTSSVLTSGTKHDVVMNLGLNFNDNLFVGFNLGVPVADYRYEESFVEAAVNPSDFAIDYSDGVSAEFSHAVYRYNQSSSIEGAYAKVGVIWAPAGGFRLGAAIQTPTSYSIQDRWQVEGSTTFTDKSFGASASSPVNEYSYQLRTPARFNIGAAYTFLGVGLVSFDFETADYSTMRFKTIEGDSQYFDAENDVNRYFACPSFSGRLGIEYKPAPSLSLRAGAAYQTSSQCNRYDSQGNEINAATYLAWYDDFATGRDRLGDRVKFTDVVTSYSVGMGYSSDGAFFADFAVRKTVYPVSTFNPYSDYISGNGDYLPQVETRNNSVADIILTLGWRF